MDMRRVMKGPTRSRTLAVEDGEIACPRQGVIDLELCWICPAHGGSTRGGVQDVICTMNEGDLRTDPRPTVH
jgi:hypothetical protein